MIMTPIESILTIILMMLATMLTRFLPFLLFPTHKTPPKAIQYLGNVLPYAVMGLLVIYALKDVNFVGDIYGLPEIISIVCIVILHIWKKNILLSISVGTILYMILIQIVF